MTGKCLDIITMPTIRDVAREAGVSIATVSYVLNNKTDAVSQETCRLVTEAAQRIGYRPNITARNLRANRTCLIGYPYYEAPTYAAPSGRLNTVIDWFSYALARAAERCGYHLLTFTYPPDNPLPVFDELIRTSRVDAFVLSGTRLNDERIRFLIERNFPFATFGRANPEWQFPWVDTDGAQGIRDAVSYLVALGHERIAMAAWHEDSLAGQHRVSGYIEALHVAGLPLRDDYLYRGEHDFEAGRSAMRQWAALPQSERPTAVISVSDLVAVGVIAEAEQRGMLVPRDLSVIGFDDTPMTEFLRPALTTIQQPIPEIGETLVATLDAILSKQSVSRTGKLLPPRLIMRDSCAPPPVLSAPTVLSGQPEGQAE